ncbi:MAG: phosphoethanolamine--lipid A transferase [Pseudomonadota bacterium]|nr:phosphoethanolamine--lipid A transferase [Pseudomonadota bacterium]
MPTHSRLTVPATVEQLLALASLFWALTANRLFLVGALQNRSASETATWVFALALLAILATLHYALFALFATRWTIKPLLAVLIVATAFATYFMQAYGVYLDPSMLRNMMHTDMAETRELLSWSLLPHLLLYAALPLGLLWRVRIVPRPWLRGTLIRVGTTVLALVLGVGTLLAIFQPFSSLMRNHRDLRYLITPANYVWSAGVVVAEQTRGAAKPRQAIGFDAKPGPLMAARSKPLVVILVVGETARAANWGLNGYARQTTPELAKLPVINFPNVSSCGTNTEASLPCMFAPVGRRHYDEARIRGSESLLHVLARAGVAVHWRDNQSGCKGVCEGLPQDEVISLHPPGLCTDGHCLDEGLLQGLVHRLATAHGTQLLVLHMLGNHGPAYFRRYPPAFARFQPACQTDDLRLCGQAEIVNAYDNALLYTDHVLASVIAKLAAASGSVDSALIYVSDHGESLGESNLFLHGMPYAIAPNVQTHVPMIMWLSAGLPQDIGLNAACLQRRAEGKASHDNLFHTLMGLLDVKSALYEATLDLTAGCRTVPAP